MRILLSIDYCSIENNQISAGPGGGLHVNPNLTSPEPDYLSMNAEYGQCWPRTTGELQTVSLS